jgi:plasmid maintenance system antidote protein VapI
MKKGARSLFGKQEEGAANETTPLVAPRHPAVHWQLDEDEDLDKDDDYDIDEDEEEPLTTEEKARMFDNHAKISERLSIRLMNATDDDVDENQILQETLDLAETELENGAKLDEEQKMRILVRTITVIVIIFLIGLSALVYLLFWFLTG